MKKLVASLSLLCASVAAMATDYVYTPDELGTKISEVVKYQFSDNVAFTPATSGLYSFNVTLANWSYGCSTRYCTSKGSYYTALSNESLTDGVTVWQPASSGILQVQLVAGTAYTLNLSGVGYGTGRTVGQGMWSLTVYQVVVQTAE